MKSAFSVIAGLLSGFLFISVAYAIALKIYVPEGMDITEADWGTIQFLMKIVPFGAFYLALMGYAVGSFLGGFVSCVISPKMIHPIIVSGGLLIAGIINLYALPHPVWFGIISLLIFFPFAFFGGKIGVAIKKKHIVN